MKRIKQLSVACLLAFALSLLFWQIGRTHAATPSTSTSSCGGWSVVNSPNPTGSMFDYFFGVSAISTSDVWTVGEYSNAQSLTGPLIAQWNGSQWSIIPNPATTSGSALSGVAAVASNDVWAVGQEFHIPLIEHWNGSQWSIVSSPKLKGTLNSVTAISTTDVWAVGNKLTSGVTQTLVEHWDGAQWTVVSSPNASHENTLVGVTAVDANDIWAVGKTYYNNRIHPFYTLTEHWDGTQWSIVPSPTLNTSSALNGVAAVSSSNVYAVGYDDISSRSPDTHSLIERWNGSKWNVVASPNNGFSELYSIAAISASNIWAVGDVSGSQANQTFTEHWDGKHWSIVASPNPGSGDNELLGVAAVPSTQNVWAVGFYDPNPSSNSQTLTEYYC